MRSVYRSLLLLVLVVMVAAAGAKDDKSDKDSISLSIGGVKPGESRSAVEQALGGPIYVEADTHGCHYGNGIIVQYEPDGLVVNVSGPQLDIDGKPSWITLRKDLDKALADKDEDGKPKPSPSPSPGAKEAVYPKYGLTAYLDDEKIIGFLLEPGFWQVTNGILWKPGQPAPTLDDVPAQPQELPITRAWALAKHVFEACFRELTGHRHVEVDRVVNLGGGHFRNASAASIEVPGTEWSGDYIVLVPKREADAGLNARSLKEILLLDWLGKLDLPFRVPKVIALYVAWGYCMVVRESMPGWSSEKPWETWTTVAPLLAAIHGMRLEDAPMLFPRFATRRAHAEHELNAVRRDRPGLKPVHEWMQKHLPPDEPTTMIHGDLLAHNVLMNVYDNQETPAIIDWEYAMQGDPAYDLAITTRGLRKPFKSERGLEQLLEAYRTAGGMAVTADDIRFYELCLHLRWYEASVNDEPYYDAPDQALHRLLKIMEKVKEEAG